jgi:hypothetical protein
MPDHEAYTATIELQYTPRYHYAIWRGRKNYLYSNYPTFQLRYRKGFSTRNSYDSSFGYIETSIYQQIQLGLFDYLSYSFNTGIFLSSKQTYLPDYKHFLTNEMFLSGKSLNNSFTMENYRYATNDKWLQAQVTYASHYLLLKNIPFMQSLPVDEAVHLKTLWTPAVNFNEAGYSIGLGKAGRVGMFFCFLKQKYDSVGIILTIPLMNTVIR